MTTSRLPEITVTCRTGHDFRTRAHGAQGVDCPECRAGGQRVKVWIRKDRPRTARELADQEAADAPAGAASVRPNAEMAARWARETPCNGKFVMLPGRDGDECPNCSGPLVWEPGRTLVYCQGCKWGGLPPAVTLHYARQAQRTEVAVRDAPGPADSRAARVRLRAIAQRMADHVSGWIEIFDPDGLSGNTERLALDYQAELAAYLPEIRQAKSEDELGEIAAEITEVTNRADSSGTMAAIDRHREMVERQQETAEREEQRAELAARAEAEHERQEREDERQAAIAARAAPKMIESGRSRSAPLVVTARPTQNTYVATAAAIATMIEHNRREKARRIEECGLCDFPHRKPAIAERLYGIQTFDWQGAGSGYQLPGSQQYRACAKHFDAADVALSKTGYVEPAACYWKLGT